MKVIVEGSDPNALVCAISLKKQGHEVEVLETEASPYSLVPASPLAPQVAAQLELGPSLKIVGRQGFSSDGKNCLLKLREISGDVTQRDQERWRDFVTLMNNASELYRGLAQGQDQAPIAQRWREFGRRQALEVMRLPWESLSQLLHTWFESDLLKATLAAAALKGTRQGPFASGTAFLLLQRWAQGEFFGRTRLEADALKNLAESAGVQFRQDAVQSYGLNLGEVESMTTQAGEELKADAFVTSADPTKCLAGQMGEGQIEPEQAHALQHWRCQSSTAVAVLEVQDEWNGAWVNFCDTLEDLEKAYDPTKYGNSSDKLFAEVDAQSGKAYLQHLVGDDLSAKVSAFLEERGLKITGDILTPESIEKQFGAGGGHLYGGDKVLWQSLHLREAFRNPLPGLYLCGAATGPGDYSGVSGQLCAQALLANSSA